MTIRRRLELGFLTLLIVSGVSVATRFRPRPGDGPKIRAELSETRTLGEPIAIRPEGGPFPGEWGLYPALGDLDDDGLEDLVIGNPRGQLRFYPGLNAKGPREFGRAIWFHDLCPDGQIPVG